MKQSVSREIRRPSGSLRFARVGLTSGGMLVAALLAACEPSARPPEPPAQEAAPAAGARPEIHLPEARTDLGRHAGGLLLEHTLPVVNLGDGPLEIEDIETSCKCTVATGAGEVVAAGEVLEVPVRIETDRASAGLHQESVRIRSNDPDQPVIEAILDYEVWRAFLVTPNRLHLGRVRRFERPEAKVRVGSTGLEPLGEVRARDPSGHLEVVGIEHLTGPPAGFSLRVRGKGGAPVGELQGELLFETEDTERPRGRIAWFATVLPDIEFSPKQQLDLGSIEPAAGVARRVSVFSSSGRAVELEDVRLEDASLASHVEVDWQPGAASRHEVVLRVRPDAPPGPLRGVLVMATDDPDLPERRLPFFGIVRD